MALVAVLLKLKMLSTTMSNMMSEFCTILCGAYTDRLYGHACTLVYIKLMMTLPLILAIIAGREMIMTSSV